MTSVFVCSLLVLVADPSSEPSSFGADRAEKPKEIRPIREEPDAPSDASNSATATSATLTLAELLSAAERQNVDRRMTLEASEKSEAEVRQAWSMLLPGLTVQASWTHNQYETEIPVGVFGPDPISLTPADQLDLVARVDLPLVDTGRWMRASAAGRARDGAKARSRLALDQVRRAVATGWYMYAGATALEASTERSVSVAEAQLELQRLRFESGTVPELDLFRARAEVERNRQAVADAARLVALQRRNLASLSGIDPGEAAALPDPDLRPPPPLEDLEAHIQDLPAVAAARHDLEGMERMSTASKLALVPVIGAQFTERVSNASSFSGESASYTLGVVLGWRVDAPIFIAMDVQASNTSIASLALEKAVMQARDQIHADWQSLRAAIVKVVAVDSQVEAAEKARRFAASRYQAGASPQIELIQADRDLFAAEAQRILAKSDLASARVALRISAGLPIEAE